MGFWQKLLGGAMAVGGAVAAPFTGGKTIPLVGAGLGLAFGGAGAGPGTKGWVPPPLTPEEMEAMKRLYGISDTLAGTQKDLMDRSGKFTDLSLDSLSASKKYWEPIIAGDYNATGEFLAPETNAIGRQFDLAQKNMQFIPSGGGKGAAQGRAQYEKAYAISDLIGMARPAAATALSTLGGTAGGIGTSLAGTGVSAGSAATQAAEGPLNFLASRRGQDIYGGVATRGQDIALGEKTGAGIGAAVMDILKKIPDMEGGDKTGLPQGTTDPTGGIIWMKDGGVVTEPTLAMVGENGPEAVIPLTKGKDGAKDPQYEMGRKVGAMIHMLSSQGKGRRRAAA